MKRAMSLQAFFSLAFLLAFPMAALADDPPLDSQGVLIVDVDSSPFLLSTSEVYQSVVVEEGASLVVNATLTVLEDMIVRGDGEVTHGSEMTTSRLIVEGALEIETGGKIDVSGKGLGENRYFDAATGQIMSGVPRYAGGSHGGLGGGSSRSVYGDPRSPGFLGSGGGYGSTSSNRGGPGGGMMRITAGELLVNGSIRADGMAGHSSAGAGSGGALRIDAATISGSGIISAVGGAASRGGGGGRIAVFYEVDSFEGYFTAMGGSGSSSSGGPGSVYVKSADGQLTIENGYAPLDGTVDYQSVELRSGAVANLTGSPEVIEPIVVTDGARMVIGSGDSLNNLTVSPEIRGRLVIESAMTWPESLTIHGELVINVPLTIEGELIVQDGGNVFHYRGRSFELITTERVWVRSGGSIDVTGLGLDSGWYHDPNTGAPSSGAPRYSGGSHGGRGGGNSIATYGDPKGPVFVGSGGGYGSTSSNLGGRGGGSIRINTPVMQVEGSIRADGTVRHSSGGGGAGGSIFLTVDSLTGSGTITAVGGAASNGGGGGRIAVFHEASTFSGSFSVLGGAGSSTTGERGSLHLEDAQGNLIVQNAHVRVSGADSYNSIELREGGWLIVGGAASISEQIVVSAGSRLVLATGQIWDGISINPNIEGTLVLDSVVTWPESLFVGGLLIVNQPFSVEGDLEVMEGGTVRHDRERSQAELTATGTIWVKPEGRIDLNGWGYDRRRSLDPATSTVVQTPNDTGGSHGGRGGGNSLPTYGDSRRPIDIGSGGGRGVSTSTPGRGGGRIALDAPTVRVDGTISADGTNGGGSRAGSGAGGSILIETSTFTGTGFISARGGSSAYGGGGGRVAVYYDSSTYNGGFSVVGGTGGSGSGEPGTLHVEDPAGNLIVENATITLGAGDVYNSVELRPGGALVLAGSAAVHEEIVVGEGARLDIAATEAFENIAVSPRVDGTLDINAPFTWPEGLRIFGTLRVNRPLTVNGDLEIESGGIVRHYREEARAEIETTGTIWVKSGGAINLDGWGYDRRRRYDAETNDVASTPNDTGGSHGGRGGGNSSPTYGDLRNPVHMGAGGGRGVSTSTPGRGGGRIALRAGTVRVDGNLTANGTNGSGSRAGSGAGGSILIDADLIAGAGLISAKGGASAYGGGGGRIAVFYDTNEFTGTMDWRGGNGSSGNGEDGTLYFISNAGDLIMDGITASIDGSDSYRSVTLKNGAILEVDGPASVAEPIFIDEGTTIRLNRWDGAENLIISEQIDGTLEVHDDVSLPTSHVLSGRMVVNARLELENLEALPGSIITHEPRVTSMHLVVADTLRIETGSIVDANGLGLLGGPTAGFGERGATVDAATGQIVAGSARHAGGSHGTRGGDYLGGDDEGYAAPSYDDPLDPRFPGGGGGQGETEELAGGTGGGVVRIDAQVLVLDGTIEASGRAGAEGEPGSGGGAGGSIVLTLGEWRGSSSGRVVAAGGNGGTVAAGGGAGGLVRIIVALDLFEGSIHVPGGSGGSGAADGLIGDEEGSPPIIRRQANEYAVVGVPYAYGTDGHAIAAGSAPIQWNRVSGPEGFNIDRNTGRITWIPREVGDEAVTIAASNSFGSDTYTFEVAVRESSDSRPTAIAQVSPDAGSVPLDVMADASLSQSDPDFPITTYRWDFGDGSEHVHAIETEHTYQQPGGYLVRLEVINTLGLSDESVHSISVERPDGARPPSARIVATATEGTETLTVGFSCDCRDGSSPIVGYRWDFGDGSLSDAQEIERLFGPGGHEVRLTVFDDEGLSATDRVFISVSDGENLPPVVVAQALPVSGPAPLSVQYRASYADLDGEVVDAVWRFPDGTTSRDLQPVYLYEDPGSQVATITVTDDGGLVSTATVEVTVTDAEGLVPPRILSVPFETAVVGEPYRYNEEGRALARGDRPLSWSLGRRLGDEIVGVPDDMTVDSVTGAISWTPTADQIGEQTVTLAVSNAAGADLQEWVVKVTDGSAESGGCGCTGAGEGAGPPWALLALLGLFLFGAGQKRKERDATSQ